ncbi:hypothetical protein JCM30760_08400 [Thiomicrorhabdus hydrogeniphila]
MSFDKKETIYIVCQSNESTGLGHLIRCISLTKSLQKTGQNIQFYGDFSSKGQVWLENSELEFVQSSMNIAELLTVLPSCSNVVLDSYQYDAKDLNPNLNYVLIDDFCRLTNYLVAGVINFTLMASSFDYQSKGASTVALGTKYFLPNPSLSQPVYEFCREIKNILILIGSGDKFDLIPKIIKALDSIQQPIHLRVITDKKGLKQSTHQIDVLPFQAEINKHYDWADFCITSGGLAKYEAAYLGKPSAVISLTESEQIETEHFAQADLCFDFGLVNNFEEIIFAKKLNNILNNIAIRQQAFKACQNHFYINSSDKAAQFVLDCFHLRKTTEV